MPKKTAERKKRGHTCFSNKFHGHVSHCDELMSRVWPVNFWFRKVSKRDLISRPSWKQSRTSFLLSNKLKHFFCFSFISGTFGNKRKLLEQHRHKSMTAWRPFCFRQTCQNLPRTTRHQLTNWNATFMCWTWEEPEQWTGNRHFIFLLSSTRTSSKMPILSMLRSDWLSYH